MCVLLLVPFSGNGRRQQEVSRSEPVKARGDSREEEEERRQDGRRMDWRGIKMEEYCR